MESSGFYQSKYNSQKVLETKKYKVRSMFNLQSKPLKYSSLFL